MQVRNGYIHATDMFLISTQGHFEWISDALLPVIQTIPVSLIVEMRLFITGAVRQDQLLQDSFSGSTAVLTIEQGRPDTEHLIKREIARAAGDISVSGTLLFSK